jgi:hypothetical protein
MRCDRREYGFEIEERHGLLLMDYQARQVVRLRCR